MTRLGALVALAALAALASSCAGPTGPPGPAGSAAPPPPGASGTIRALTYNVAGLPEGLSGSHPATNTPLISPRLNAYDLVLTQEDWADPVPPVPGFDFHHDTLIAQADHPHLSVPATPPQGKDPRRPEALVADGLNLLSRYPLGESTHRMWDGCFGSLDTSDGGAGDCMALKGFTLTRATLADGVTVDVYDVHGEAGGTQADQQLQAADYRQLAAFVNGHSAGRAVILGGDTNLHTDGRHRDAGGPADREIWQSFLTATGLADVCAGQPCADSIDKFAVRTGGGVTLAARSPLVDGTFTGPDGSPLSDHRPVSVVIDWTASAATGGSGPGPTGPGTTGTPTATTTTAVAPATTTTAAPPGGTGACAGGRLPGPTAGEPAEAAVRAIEAGTVGCTEGDVTARAGAAGWTVRVVHRDGEDLMGTMDHRTDRLGLRVTGGTVTALTVG